MKRILVLAPLILSACITMTPSQNIAFAGAAAGNAYAINLLNQRGESAVLTLKLLAEQLPLIPQGKVSAHDLGVLEGNLQLLKGTLSSQNPKLADNVASIANLFAKAQVNAAGGNITLDQAALFAACQNFANGLQNGIDYWEGKQSVIPGPVPLPTSQ